jgi:putative tryptophan/tyrosine transport system substrate-binding protein
LTSPIEPPHHPGMDRRRFLLTSVAGIFAAPLAAEAQQGGNVPRIEFLSWGFPPPSDTWGEPFRERLRELGYVEGQNIVVEYRWAEQQGDRAADLAAELVRLRVDVIVAWVGTAVRAAQNATPTIPIVMGAVADPLRSGLVASLARPGGNTTGPSMMTLDIAGKRLELLREVLPNVRRVAFLSRKTGRQFVRETQVAAQQLGVRIQPLVVEGPEELQGAFAAVLRERAEALIVEPWPTLVRDRRIVDFAAKHRLPTISDYRSFPEAGALMSYGANARELIRRTADYVHKILKGAKAADLPVENPTKLELVINLKTAKALGLTIPPSLLARADQVIE